MEHGNFENDEFSGSTSYPSIEDIVQKTP